jgi:hypothetical protein
VDAGSPFCEPVVEPWAVAASGAGVCILESDCADTVSQVGSSGFASFNGVCRVLVLLEDDSDGGDTVGDPEPDSDAA